MKCPCKDCPIRYIGCHSTCYLYKKFDSDRKKIREIKHNQNSVSDALASIKIRHTR